MADSETQKFKYYFNTQMAAQLAEMIAAVYPSFQQRAFVNHISAQLDPLELKARVALMAAALRDFLPPVYPDAVNILTHMMGPELPDETGMFNLGAHYAPVAYFVEVYGHDHVEESLHALYEVTKRHTAEYAVRPYIAQHTARTLERLRDWTRDTNSHVRRLVSEGSRPRLPWASRLDLFIRDPRPVLDLLEPLKADPSAYVRKSVANNLNDILKDNPDAALAVIQRWNATATEDTRWIIRHGLRSLIKQGHPTALALIGVEQAAEIEVTDLTMPAEVRIGQTVRFRCTLHNPTARSHDIVVDYRVQYINKANGQRQPRVFKLRALTLKPGASLTLEKSHNFRPVTTRTYYPGKHRLEIQVNGQIAAGVDFDLRNGD